MAYSRYQENPNAVTLSAALESYTVDDLKRLAAFLPTSERPTRKADLVNLIARSLEGDGLRALWERLDRLQKAAVAEAVHSEDNRFDAEVFRAKYGDDPNWGERTRYGYDRNFSLLGLFLYNSILPNDLKQCLLEFVPKPPPITLKTTDALPDTIARRGFKYNAKTFKREEFELDEAIPLQTRNMEQTAQRDLMTVLRLVVAGKLAISEKTLFPTAGTVKAIGALLEGGDFYDATGAANDEDESDQEIGPIRAFAWTFLLQTGKLTELSGKRLVLTKAGQAALSAAPAQTLRALWKAWLKTTLLDELRRINLIRGQIGKGKSGLTAPSGRRAVIAKALADCPPGEWIQVNDFLRYMLASRYTFEVTRDPWELYISDAYYGRLGNNDTWEVLAAPYTLCLLFEYAATLGMLDVAYIHPEGARLYHDVWGLEDEDFLSRYDGLISFRLTPLGAYCLGLASTYTPAPLEARSVLRVLPNLEVVVTAPPLAAADQLTLDLYARKVSEAVWALDTPKMLTALEEGHRFGELREFLEARSSEALPGTAQRFLQDFEERSQRLRAMGTALLFECSDPNLLQLIVHDPRTKPLCFPAGERHLVVPFESESAFRKALRQLGYTIPPKETR